MLRAVSQHFLIEISFEPSYGRFLEDNCNKFYIQILINVYVYWKSVPATLHESQIKTRLLSTASQLPLRGHTSPQQTTQFAR